MDIERGRVVMALAMMLLPGVMAWFAAGLVVRMWGRNVSAWLGGSALVGAVCWVAAVVVSEATWMYTPVPNAVNFGWALASAVLGWRLYRSGRTAQNL